MQIEESGLLEAISDEHPCGEDLEDTQLLASFDAYRLFGQSAPLTGQTDWHSVRDHALEALRTSKDLRLLAHLSAAIVRTDGIVPFLQLLSVPARWLESWPDEVFPRADSDAVLRRNALNGFADRMAIVDGVRRAPLIVNRQLGSLSIRDIEIVGGLATQPGGEAGAADAAVLNAVLTATSSKELDALATQLNEAVASLETIKAAMSAQGDYEAAPDFTSLSTPLARTAKLISDQLALRAPAQSGESESDAAASAVNDGAVARHDIRSREDAIRALDAVASYFRLNEPSSPIPLLLERARRLVAKDFLALLEELAPDALPQARAASGIRDPNE